ncbi:hypothetical protein [Alteromonas portus]|uniref:hypothetical protein n=1 Tax=Alteromonas portus TaxID=2565549 RepID=UPI003BF88519
MKKRLAFVFIALFNATQPSLAQENVCLPLLKDGLYKSVVQNQSDSFNGNLKSYFESDTFKQDFKDGKWSLGVSGIIPVGDSGLTSELGLDFGASESSINNFQKKIREAKNIKIDTKFYQSSVTAVPDVAMAKAYVECIEGQKTFGFYIKNIVDTQNNVVFNISYRKRLSSDPMPVVKSIQVLGSTKVIQGLTEGSEIPDEFSISAERYPEKELILSINTDRENLVSVVEAKDDGFAKEFPIGSIITTVLDWDSFSQITEGKSSSTWDAGKSRWAPADGRSVSASKYTRKTGKAEAPDLRGVFLRGLNQFDPFYNFQVSDKQADVDSNRSVGSLQLDAFQGHKHFQENRLVKSGQDDLPNTPDQRPKQNGADNSEGKYEAGFGTPRISSETRPKNVAVYFYIRIN